MTWQLAVAVKLISQIIGISFLFLKIKNGIKNKALVYQASAFLLRIDKYLLQNNN